MSTHLDREDDSDSGSDSSALALASIDFTGVDFDVGEEDASKSAATTEIDAIALSWGSRLAFGDFSCLEENNDQDDIDNLRVLGKYLACGRYADILRNETAKAFFDSMPDADSGATVASRIRQQVIARGTSILACIELELIGVAALNLFLQNNYTGPSHDDEEASSTLADVNPHGCFSLLLRSSIAQDPKRSIESDEENKECLTKPKRNTLYQNAVLSELAVDGEWPCQICHAPYFLLVARSILSTLANPLQSLWTNEANVNAPAGFLQNASHLTAASMWSARAVVAHERLLQAREPSVTLWKEAESTFEKCIELFCPVVDNDNASTQPDPRAATVMLQWGLAQHHFDRPGKGNKAFVQAQEYSGLAVEVTGAEGKRTKFQQKATAQMLVRATSAARKGEKRGMDAEEADRRKDLVKVQMVAHSEDEILLEKIKFEGEKENEVTELNILDQAILLALCLDVKNFNPADGLTGEEMGAFLSRVLDQHNDWMIYSTALLERAWLEFERSHSRERSILQMQALADQHTNRLTITQSTRKSVEESAPVEDRLKNLHNIVYPPRWSMIQDVADRYAALGIVTSAAELYLEIEFWDDVVECYRRAGRVTKAEQIVRERLAEEETPLMWAALGDLTKDPACYEKAVEISKGRFSSAYISLGAYYFDKGELEKAAENYGKAVEIRPLAPAVWFRLGTMSMQLGRWQTALRAFSEVVQQEPEEADAWANVAAVHMHNKLPAEAYPALSESLRHNRNNWRVWASMLYTCLDLDKFNEAIQACNVLLDLRAERQAADSIPPLEEKCVRAIVGGTLKAFHKSGENEAALESSRRTLSRVHALLDRITSSSDAEPWIFETMAYFHEQVGHDEKVLDNLMKEYRSLQAIPRWEKDDQLVRKICQVVSHIVQIHRREDSPNSLTKSCFLVRGVVRKMQAARPGDASIPDEAGRLTTLLTEIEAKLQ